MTAMRVAPIAKPVSAGSAASGARRARSVAPQAARREKAFLAGLLAAGLSLSVNPALALDPSEALSMYEAATRSSSTPNVAPKPSGGFSFRNFSANKEAKTEAAEEAEGTKAEAAPAKAEAAPAPAKAEPAAEKADTAPAKVKPFSFGGFGRTAGQTAAEPAKPATPAPAAATAAPAADTSTSSFMDAIREAAQVKPTPAPAPAPVTRAESKPAPAKPAPAKEAPKAAQKAAEKEKEKPVERDPFGHVRSKRYKGAFTFFMTQMFELGALVGIFALALNFPKEGSQALEQLTKQAKAQLDSLQGTKA